MKILNAVFEAKTPKSAVELPNCDYILIGWEMDINGNKKMRLQDKETMKTKSYFTNMPEFKNSHKLGTLNTKPKDLSKSELTSIAKEVNKKLKKK